MYFSLSSSHDKNFSISAQLSGKIVQTRIYCRKQTTQQFQHFFSFFFFYISIDNVTNFVMKFFPSPSLPLSHNFLNIFQRFMLNVCNVYFHFFFVFAYLLESDEQDSMRKAKSHRKKYLEKIEYLHVFLLYGKIFIKSERFVCKKKGEIERKMCNPQILEHNFPSIYTSFFLSLPLSLSFICSSLVHVARENQCKYRRDTFIQFIFVPIHFCFFFVLSLFLRFEHQFCTFCNCCP